MGDLRQYAISLITVAIICGILTRIAAQETTRSLLRLICGIVLLFVLIKPVLTLELPELGAISLPEQYSAQSAIEEGKELAEDAMSDSIKAACEAYILDKAADLGADIHVSVVLDSERSPCAARVAGKLSPDVKERLAQVLETDLGIAKENQSWTG